MDPYVRNSPRNDASLRAQRSNLDCRRLSSSALKEAS